MVYSTENRGNEGNDGKTENQIAGNNHGNEITGDNDGMDDPAGGKKKKKKKKAKKSNDPLNTDMNMLTEGSICPVGERKLMN